MRYKLIIPKNISSTLGTFGLGRDVVRLLNLTRDALEENGDKYRKDRYPEDPDHSFLYELIVRHRGVLRLFRFIVDDVQAPGHFSLVEVYEPYAK